MLFMLNNHLYLNLVPQLSPRSLSELNDIAVQNSFKTSESMFLHDSSNPLFIKLFEFF